MKWIAIIRTRGMQQRRDSTDLLYKTRGKSRKVGVGFLTLLILLLESWDVLRFEREMDPLPWTLSVGVIVHCQDLTSEVHDYPRVYTYNFIYRQLSRDGSHVLYWLYKAADVSCWNVVCFSMCYGHENTALPRVLQVSELFTWNFPVLVGLPEFHKVDETIDVPSTSQYSRCWYSHIPPPNLTYIHFKSIRIKLSLIISHP